MDLSSKNNGFIYIWASKCHIFISYSHTDSGNWACIMLLQEKKSRGWGVLFDLNTKKAG